jgi:predicted xylose isomerase-like sugar epimerase
MLTLDTLLPHLNVEKITTSDIRYELDELVHLAAEQDTSIETYDDEDDIESTLDQRSYWATELNNTGWDDQVNYLLSQGYEEQVVNILIEFSKSAHDTLTLEKLKSTL